MSIALIARVQTYQNVRTCTDRISHCIIAMTVVSSSTHQNTEYKHE